MLVSWKIHVFFTSTESLRSQLQYNLFVLSVSMFTCTWLNPLSHCLLSLQASCWWWVSCCTLLVGVQTRWSTIAVLRPCPSGRLCAPLDGHSMQQLEEHWPPSCALFCLRRLKLPPPAIRFKRRLRRGRVWFACSEPFKITASLVHWLLLVERGWTSPWLFLLIHDSLNKKLKLNNFFQILRYVIISWKPLLPRNRKTHIILLTQVQVKQKGLAIAAGKLSVYSSVVFVQDTVLIFPLNKPLYLISSWYILVVEPLLVLLWTGSLHCCLFTCKPQQTTE